jgi:hypothetical protein
MADNQNEVVDPLADYPVEPAPVPAPPDAAAEDVPPPPDDDPYYAPPLEAVPPPEAFEEPAAAGEGYAPRGRAHRAEAQDLTGPGLRGKVLDTLRDCLAAMQGHGGGEMIELIGFITASKEVLANLDPETAKTYRRLAELFVTEYGDDPSRTVDLDDMPTAEAAGGRAQAELTLIRSRVGRPDLPTTPSAQWRALVNHVQRVASMQALLDAADAIQRDETDEKCMEMFRAIPPPTANRVLQNADFSRTARGWAEADALAAAESPSIRLSSGYPTLDHAFTQRDGHGRLTEAFGAFGLGEFHFFVAPTGNGKSATARMLVRNVAEDLVVGWGREHDKVLIAITEETPQIVYTMAEMDEGQPFHHLADNLVIANVGASRKRFVHAVWDLVIDAHRRSKETGLPIQNCGLPTAIFLDYLGGIVEDDANEAAATERTANLILRGLCAWDVLGMELFSGESFASYAGMTWPKGMENYRPVVIAFGQFRKLDDPLWWDPDNRSCDPEDFVIQTPSGQPGWELKPGDFRIPKQHEIRGSGVVANHATSIVILHRSRPGKNPKITDPVTGEVRLTDDRARWIPVKTRNGATLPFIPMRFDSHHSGLRGQFFDLKGEEALEAGYLEVTDCYRRPGDPMLPRRPQRSPFAGIAY